MTWEVVWGRCGGSRTWFRWLRGLKMRPMSQKSHEKLQLSRFPPKRVTRMRSEPLIFVLMISNVNGKQILIYN